MIRGCSSWRDQILKEFTPKVARLTLVADPDGLLVEENPPLDPELLGLFAGVPLDQKSYLSAGGELPPQIYLFKRNLERFARPEELATQVAITLYHELGHYLGMDEEDLEELDFA